MAIKKIVSGNKEKKQVFYWLVYQKVLLPQSELVASQTATESAVIIEGVGPGFRA